MRENKKEKDNRKRSRMCVCVCVCVSVHMSESEIVEGFKKLQFCTKLHSEVLFSWIILVTSFWASTSTVELNTQQVLTTKPLLGSNYDFEHDC